MEIILPDKFHLPLRHLSHKDHVYWTENHHSQQTHHNSCRSNQPEHLRIDIEINLNIWQLISKPIWTIWYLNQPEYLTVDIQINLNIWQLIFKSTWIFESWYSNQPELLTVDIQINLNIWYLIFKIIWTFDSCLNSNINLIKKTQFK